MKIEKNLSTWRRRTKVIVAGAVLTPVLVGSFAAANAVGGQASHSTPSRTGQASLTDEGLRLARESGLPSSGSISVSSATAGSDGFRSSGVHTMTGAVDGAQVTGSAALTDEGKKMVKESGTTSGSVSAGPDGVVH